MTTKRRKKKREKKKRRAQNEFYLVVSFRDSSDLSHLTKRFSSSSLDAEKSKKNRARARTFFSLSLLQIERYKKCRFQEKKKKKETKIFDLWLSLSLSEPWWPLQNPHPFSHVPTRRQLFERKENPYYCVVVFSTLVVRGVLFFHERERERERHKSREEYIGELLLCSEKF